MPNIRIKNIEAFEDKEKWENIFTYTKDWHLRSVLGMIEEAYKQINLDQSSWDYITKKYKEIQGVEKAECNWLWLKKKLIPDIEKSIQEIKNNKSKWNRRVVFHVVIEALEDVLRVAKTCVKYKKSLIYAY